MRQLLLLCLALVSVGCVEDNPNNGGNSAQQLTNGLNLTNGSFVTPTPTPAPSLNYEGVSFTALEQAQVLDIANQATSTQLTTAGLPSSVAVALLAGRPFSSVAAIAAVPGVETAELNNLKRMISSWPGPSPTPTPTPTPTATPTT